MSGPPADAAITLAVKRLRSGDDEAAAELWKHYFEPLVRTARKRLSGNPRGMADEEDVALSVFKSFCLGMPQGRFAKLKDRRDLWTLLLRMLERKAVDHWRHETRQRRGGGAVRSETALDGADGLDRIPGPESLPQLFSVLNECVDELRDDSLRVVAVLHLQGYSTTEIGRSVGTTARSVQRKLRLIREQWDQGTDM